MQRLSFALWVVWWCPLATLAAEEPWQQPFTEDVAGLLAAAVALESPEDAIADGLLAVQRLQIDREGRMSTEQRLVYRVLKEPEAAQALAAVSALYAPWYQREPLVKARVITADGTEHWLDPTTLSDRSPLPSIPGGYESIQLRSGPLPAVRAKAIVEIQITIEANQPLLEGLVSYELPFVSLMPFRENRVIIEAPTTTDVRWLFHDLEPVDPIRATQGKLQRLEFVIPDIEQFQARQVFGMLASGTVSTPAFRFAVGGDWSRVAQTYYELTESQRKGATTPGDWPTDVGADREETIRKILRQMHDRVRYEALELGMGAIEPRPPDVTLERQYGDCKDKALLLRELLARVGIESRLALVRTGPARDLDPELPGFGLFNHVILYVPGDEPLWIDATAAYTPVGELPLVVQDRYALIVDPATERLVKTPASDSSDNRMISVISGVFSARGDRLDLVNRQELFGALAETLRQRIAVDPESLKKSAEHASPPHGYKTEVGPVETDDPRELRSPFSTAFEVRFQRPGAAFPIDTLDVAHEPRRALQHLSPMLWFKAPEDADPEPITLPMAYQSLQEGRFEFPAGYRPKKLPDSEIVELGPMRLETVWEQDEPSAVSVRTSFDTVVGELSAEEVEEVRERLSRIKSAPVKLELENIVAAEIAAGRFVDALEAAREGTTTAPDALFARIRLMDALLAVGAGATARADARGLTVEFPEEAAAWAALGRALSHDLLGRRFGPGFDRDGAIEAYQRALELDPDGRQPVGPLVDALGYGVSGIRFDPESARMDEAIELLEDELKRDEVSEADRKKLDGWRAALLAHTARYEQLLEVAEAGRTADFHRAAALSMLESPEAAVSALEAEHDQGRVSGELVIAAYHLEKARRYPEAASLFEAAADRASPERASPSLSSARRMRARSRYEESKSEGPRRLVEEWFTWEFRDDWRQVMKRASGSACGVRELRSAQAEQSFERRVRNNRYWPNAIGDFPKYRIDEVIPYNELEVEGDDERGYVIRGYVKSTDQDRQRRQSLIAFAERQNGELKLIDATALSNFSLSDLACTLAPRLEEQGVDAVAPWLDAVADIDLGVLADFQTFWCDYCERSQDDARIALSILKTIRDTSMIEEVYPLLREAYDAEEQLDRRAAIARPLSNALRHLGRHEEAAEVVVSIARKHPGLIPAATWGAGMLSRIGRAAEAQDLLDLALKEGPDNYELIRSKLTACNATGDVEAAMRILGRLTEIGRGNYSHKNDVGWVAVVAARPTPEVLELVEEALAESNNSSAVLNTHAALLALDGQPDRARKAWLESVQRSGRALLHSGDEYVAGLIFEQYGLEDEAVAAYQRAAALEADFVGSGAKLAARALERLRAE